MGEVKSPVAPIGSDDKNSMTTAIIYLLVIAAAELVTFYVQPVWGIVCHIMALGALILHSALVHMRSQQQLLLSLTLAPLVRIISWSLPLINIPQIWWYPAIYIPLLAAAFMVARIAGHEFKQIGLNFKQIPIQLVVASTGFLFGIMEYYILKPEPMIDNL
ncbi:MAG: hypothetical protein PHN78_01500, partial [Dehalococcoidales bacterium]|nr:hypothetical protein [Dehalococcoidales bacterium]